MSLNPEPESTAEVVEAIGTDRFGRALLNFAKHLAPVDKCMAFAFPAGGRPATVVAEGIDAHYHEIARHLADDYISGAFEDDPNLQRAHKVVEGRSVIYCLKPRQIENSEFKLRYYIEPEIRQEFSIIFRGHDVLYFLSLFRGSGSVEFNDHQVCLLRQSARLFEAVLSKHYQFSGDDLARADAASSDHVRASAAPGGRQPSVEAVRRLFLRAPLGLTPREAEIVSMIALGRSTVDMSKALAISPNTVCTHRKRAYAKLSIASQSDLFALYFRLA